jgi:hypothetical protein
MEKANCHGVIFLCKKVLALKKKSSREMCRENYQTVRYKSFACWHLESLVLIEVWHIVWWKSLGKFRNLAVLWLRAKHEDYFGIDNFFKFIMGSCLFIIILTSSIEMLRRMQHENAGRCPATPFYFIVCIDTGNDWEWEVIIFLRNNWFNCSIEWLRRRIQMRKREALPCVTIHHWDKLALSYSGPPNLEGGHPMASLVSKTANF